MVPSVPGQNANRSEGITLCQPSARLCGGQPIHEGLDITTAERGSLAVIHARRSSLSAKGRIEPPRVVDAFQGETARVLACCPRYLGGRQRLEGPPRFVGLLGGTGSPVEPSKMCLCRLA